MDIVLPPMYPNFNPRSHEGSDIPPQKFLSNKAYFNPRSHEGSDDYDLVTQHRIHNFNPRSHEGSDSNFRQKFSSLLAKIV